MLLLDPDGFFDPLAEQLDRIVASGYLSADRRERLVRVTTPQELRGALGQDAGR